MLKCKQATELISQSLDRDLTLHQRIQLKFHLFICTGCTNCNKQIALIHKAMGQLRKHQ
ncbi:MAG: zf-HC2 domain-containing protein [Gammaproteobacteria bacterium]|nr:zf-HC2 domain-containing protein [Gammaproteobacteria bacterium]